MDMDHVSGRRRSLFVVLLREEPLSPYVCSILQFKSKQVINLVQESAKQHNHVEESAAPELPAHLDLEEYVAHFVNPKVPASWIFSPLSNEELFMVPYFIDDAYDPPLDAVAFNLRTKTLRTTNPPFSFNSCILECAVSLGGSVYYMPHPCDQHMSSKDACHRFQRYVPSWGLWQDLQPFSGPLNTYIKATAVWGRNILFNMVGHRSCEMWVFNDTKNSWYPVTVKDEHLLCYRILGEAVVLGNTIFALKDEPYNSLLALSIQREEIDGDGVVYTCSLLCEISVAGMSRILSMCGSASMETRSLVHLGKDNFCLVQTCLRDSFPVVYQPILVTYMTLEENNSMIVTDTCFHKLPIGDEGQFIHAFCFSLPEFKTPPTTLQQAQKSFVIDPFPEGIDREHYMNILRGVSKPRKTLKIPKMVDSNPFDANSNYFCSGLSKLPIAPESYVPDPSSGITISPYYGYAQLNLTEPNPFDAVLSQGGCPPPPPPPPPKWFKTVEGSKTSRRDPAEGKLMYNGRPVDSFPFPDSLLIVDRLQQQYMQSLLRNKNKKSCPSKKNKKS